MLIKAIPDPIAEKQLQQDIDDVLACYSDLLLTIHPQKTKLLVCSIAPQPLSATTSFHIAGHPIDEVGSLKYLGIVLDRRLDFGLNARASALRSRRILGALRGSCKTLLGSKAFVQIYVAKIMPILLYCIAVTAPSKKGPFCALEKAHRLAARVITIDWSSSYQQLLGSLQWRSISQICFEHRCLLMWKYINGIRHLPAGTIIKKSCTD